LYAVELAGLVCLRAAGVREGLRALGEVLREKSGARACLWAARLYAGVAALVILFGLQVAINFAFLTKFQNKAFAALVLAVAMLAALAAGAFVYLAARRAIFSALLRAGERSNPLARLGSAPAAIPLALAVLAFCAGLAAGRYYENFYIVYVDHRAAAALGVPSTADTPATSSARPGKKPKQLHLRIILTP